MIVILTGGLHNAIGETTPTIPQFPGWQITPKLQQAEPRYIMKVSVGMRKDYVVVNSIIKNTKKKYYFLASTS